ncbi:MAG: hypothetical protein COT81_03835 [Candidatus Buchananbacteria bacterium CG10_big_fil_rev_8_21_14_0_10_42_9]|uniref:DUF2178 domain-containing protein n=1 Tax=Candidatus Buchananbacteria bacterium CG10_big_fil_rev_8_21_14_0_10_42_9 TaxID=1974526 RepID=A0A2H0W0N9_9BACT|nr:MAG: hypothetical protein COT81_03835 [Candidatus Buchananbacteria bacterium CG10_big_fil_rev_8_21_14_0_10_42_9]
MKNKYLPEVILGGILILLLTLFLNPFKLYMADMYLMMIAAGLIVAFAIFAGFIWKEKGRDERETWHIMLSGRMAFLAGALVLVVAILVESFKHQAPDPWLVAALGVMVLAKIIGRIYNQINN